jgi:hypothetical protein
MQAIADLQKQWRERERFRRLHAHLGLEKEGVVLGANTALAKRDNDGAFETDEARAFTLLAVTYGKPVGRSVLGKFNLASKHARAGNEAMAAMHIALAGLPVLRDPEDAAKRLFIANGLMEHGVAPRDIWMALEFDPAPLDALTKFNSDEARVPAGSGRPSGRWTRDGSDALISPAPELAPSPPAAAPSTAARALEAASAAARAAARLIPEIAPKLLGVAADAAPPIAFASALLESSPTGGELSEGDVVGRPDLRYSWHPDELAPRITRTSDGSPFTDWLLDRGDKYFRDQDGRIVAQIVGHAVIADAVFFAHPGSGPSWNGQRYDPELCPEPPGPDKQGMVGERGNRSRAYANYMKGLINPNRPTPPDYGYQLPNPEQAGKPVFYDDCMHVNGWMVDYKGFEYADLVTRKSLNIKLNVARKWVRQANNQINASDGRPIVWFFAEEGALDYARKVFDQPGNEELQRIVLVYAPPPRDAPWRWRSRTKKVVP